MKETFYVIRHGERVDHSEDSTITTRGVLQAREVGEELKERGGISVVYTSPLLRALQTAEIIAQTLNVPLNPDDRLTERVRWGDRDGETYEEFLGQWQMTLDDRSYSPPMGDSSINTGARFMEVLEEIRAGEKAVIVSHSGAIWDFLQRAFINREPNSQEDLVKPFALGFCSITEVQRENDEYILVNLNDTTHLSEGDLTHFK